MALQSIVPLAKRNRTGWRISSGRSPMVYLSTNNKTPQSSEMVETMRQRVQQQDPAAAWESLWRDGITPWDLGGPTEALIAELSERALRPRMTLIPGCGSGYDLVSLGRYLDQGSSSTDDGPCTIVGLELSKSSLQKAQRLLEESTTKQGPFHPTTISLYDGDFFASPASWIPVFSTCASPPKLSYDMFDFIFDYTFFCAIPPDQRRSWGQQMKQLLAQDGKLLTVMFPFQTSARRAAEAELRGPPYSVTLESYRNVLDDQGLAMDTPLPYASVKTAPHRRGQEVIGWWGKAKL